MNWERAVSTEIDWIRNRTVDPDGVTGFEPDIPGRSVWILNAMYELRAPAVELSHDEIYRIEVDSGWRAPSSLEGKSFDFGSVTGAQLGWTSRPSGDWRRLRWAELAERLDQPIVRQGYRPSHRNFPGVLIDGESWPVSIRPPGEGSLDLESWRSLAGVLKNFTSPRTECMAFYCPLMTNDWDDPRVYRGSISDIERLEDLHYPNSPSNIWPVTRDWFVYTDYDLWGTRVWGEEDLLEAIVADEHIEAYFQSEIM